MHNIKQEYSVGELTWIHGIVEGKLTKGKVIKSFNLEEAGYNPSMIFYVVEIETHVDPILEIRSWETMSQDEKGPIGAFRNFDMLDSTNKAISKVGYYTKTHNESTKKQTNNRRKKKL